MSDDKFGNYLTCSREKGTIFIFACVIAYRNMFFWVQRTTQSLLTIFSWYFGENAIDDFSLFGTQETAITSSRKVSCQCFFVLVYEFDFLPAA